MVYNNILSAYVIISLVAAATAFSHGASLIHGSGGTCTHEISQRLHTTSFSYHRRYFTQQRLSASDDTTEGVTGVTLKMAFDSSSVWGVADLSETKSERFTSPISLDMVHRLRRDSSAVLVGRGTVERDDCSLTVRRVQLNDGESQPIRVVIDPSLNLIGKNYTLLMDGLPTIIYHLESESPKAPISDSVSLVGLSRSSFADGSRSLISPTQVVKDLASRGLKHIMVEGGPATACSFLEARAVDRAILVKAPIEFEVPVPAGINENMLKSAGLQKIGDDIMGGDTIEYWSRPGLPWPDSDFLDMWP